MHVPLIPPSSPERALGVSSTFTLEKLSPPNRVFLPKFYHGDSSAS